MCQQGSNHCDTAVGDPGSAAVGCENVNEYSGEGRLRSVTAGRNATYVSNQSLTLSEETHYCFPTRWKVDNYCGMS